MKIKNLFFAAFIIMLSVFGAQEANAQVNVRINTRNQRTYQRRPVVRQRVVYRNRRRPVVRQRVIYRNGRRPIVRQRVIYRNSRSNRRYINR